MKKNLLIMILLAGVSLQAKSQIIFQKTFETTLGGNGYCSLQTSDGGYCFAGSTATGTITDVYLIKTDIDGDTLWTRTFGGSGTEEAWSFQQTADSGYIMTGYTTSFGFGGADIYLIKTDSGGDTLWTKTLGGTANDRGNCVQQTNDGGYIITGFTSSTGPSGTDICLIKFDANGDTTWAKSFGGADIDIGTSVQQTTDGGYIIAGVINSFGSGGGDLCLIKTDLNGDTLWQKAYGDVGYDYGYSVRQTTDGGYIAAGFTQSFGAGDDDLFLVKTDAMGDLTWSRTFGGTAVDRARAVQQTTDGGYILTGWAYSFRQGDSDFYLVKTDANGDELWSNVFGGSLDDNARFVQQTNDGGYILTGGTGSYGTGSYDLYAIKTDSVGYSGCSQTNPPTIMTDPGTQVISFSSNADPVSIVVSSTGTIIGGGAAILTVCTNVGLGEMVTNNSIGVYPNPSEGDFVISFEENLAYGTVEIYNAIGERVYMEKIYNESEKHIDLGSISPGIYFVKITDEVNSYSSKIIVKD